MVNPSRDLARDWLAKTYRNIEGLLWVGAFAPTYAGQVFDDYDKAADYAIELDQQQRPGVYIRTTTLRRVPNAGSRGGALDSWYLPGLWADIDLKGPNHKHRICHTNCPIRHQHKWLDLPGTEASARQIIEETQLPTPTLWVHSGGGLYPWWMLETPEEITPNNYRMNGDISAEWQKIIALTAARLGFTYGAGVGDLARVLRLPGTVNRKTDDHALCHIMDPDSPMPMYSMEELREGLWRAIETNRPAPRIVENVSLPSPQQETPFDHFERVTDWADALLLGGLGWEVTQTLPGGERRWRHPDASNTVSATTGRDAYRDRLYVFSDNTVFPAFQSITKPGAYAIVHCDGDMAQAATALATMGYGPPRLDRGAVERQAIEDLTPPQSPAQAPEGPEAPDAQAEREMRVAAALERLKVTRDAKLLLSAEEHAQHWRVPPSVATLHEELQLPDDEVAYRIDKLMAVGSNTLLVAQFKAGKTTLCANLVKALADGQKFLNYFDVSATGVNIAYWNYEVERGQFRRWLRELEINNTDRVSILNLRGYSIPPIHRHTKEFAIDWLQERGATVWIVDPFARAFGDCGDDNASVDVSRFLDALDEIKERAGVKELILPAHTGRAAMEEGKERAKGSTRLDDWADSRWLLTIGAESERFLRATGRDIDVPEAQVRYVDAVLTYGGWDRRGRAQRVAEERILGMLTTSGPATRTELLGVLGSNELLRECFSEALTALLAGRKVHTVSKGNSTRWMAGPFNYESI